LSTFGFLFGLTFCILIHLVCPGPETQISFNKIVLLNSRAQKLFKTSSSYFYFDVRFRAATARGFYFLLLFLRPFSRTNCRRGWGRYFWDLEGGGGGGAILGVLIGGSEPEWEMQRTGWEGSTGCIMHRVHTSY